MIAPIFGPTVDQMASIEKRGKTWRARVRKDGANLSETFDTKAEALAWAVDIERKIKAGQPGSHIKRTLGDLLEKYAAEVTPKKRGKEWELKRVAWLLRQPIAKEPLADLGPPQWALWRDSRLREASGETVRRDFNLISHALNVAVKEWSWLAENPLKRVSRPAGNPPRERIASDDEIERLCHAGGYVVGQPARTATARAVAAFVFSVETGMRSGEILALDQAKGHIKESSALLGRTKNGDARVVALSARAKQILADVGGSFGLTGAQRDALWRKVVKRAGIEGLHFHDGRATAITRLSKRLDPLALARMVGHRNIAELLTYYRESMDEIAKRL